MTHLQAVESQAAERYMLGEMTEAERDAFEGHFFECVECAEDMRAAEALLRGVRGRLLERTTSAAVVPLRPSPVTAPARWRPAVLVPWAAAATLAVAVGYQWMLLSSVPPVPGRHATALAPATLRPATRGADVSVTPGPGGLVTLAVDLGGAELGGRLRYALFDAQGREVVSGDAPAPEGGAPLLLMLADGVLSSGASYNLVVHDFEDRGLTRQDYRFSVSEP